MAAERILIVDDDPSILRLCHQILQADGYRCTDARRGEEALARLESEPFDLLLTDIRLPGLNGLQITQRLRERGLELVVVTMTGYSNMEMAIEALSLGVAEFIVKPFSPDLLRRLVARALEKGRLRRENLRLRALLPLVETAQAFAASRTRDRVCAALFAAAGRWLQTDELLFLSVTAEGAVLTVAGASGQCWSHLLDRVYAISSFDDGVSLLGFGIQVWDELAASRLPFPTGDQHSIVSVPMRTPERALAVLLAACSAPPSPGETEALNLVAAQAAAALENVNLLGEISRAYVNVRELDQLKGEFINLAGHELRTPVAVMLRFASLLRDQLTGDRREYAAQIVDHAQRLQRIADNMLNVQDLEAGHKDLRLESLPVAQVVREVVDAYRPLALEREQAIDVEVSEHVGTLTADRAMLDVMLGNLVSNAIKFSPDRSRVVVGADGDSTQVTLVVRDQGGGLTGEQAAHVFDPFYRASTSLGRSGGGLGLGLTLAREMAHAHGGKIWVESQASAGSSFYISLPRVPS